MASPASQLPSPLFGQFVYYCNPQSQRDLQRWHPHGASSYAMNTDPHVLQMSPRSVSQQSTMPYSASLNGTWPDHGMVSPPPAPNLSGPMPSQQSVPISPQHGPPRRPIQSKYALWVGNIPGHAHILTLRDHFFTPENAREILSVVFTPSSNSGFINLRTEEACKASMRRFNKSFFYGVPLNCRARKPTISSPPVSQARTPPTADSSGSSTLLDSPVSANSSFSSPGDPNQDLKQIDSNEESAIVPDCSTSNINGATDGVVLDGLQGLSLRPGPGRNRYFIIKSLTLDDLVNSVKSRRWSTQMHNEHVLDEAFKNGDYVYLIFSVNRSREYFGYARMTTATNYDPAPIVTSTPPIQYTPLPTQPSKPPIVRTPAIGHIPAGRIVDELCRGKIFWEIEGAEQTVTEQPGVASLSMYGSQKSFGIEWLSLKRVPFRQTTHLRNSMNENKEVKIARDGTELDADVGRRLCSLFHLST